MKLTKYIFANILSLLFIFVLLLTGIYYISIYIYPPIFYLYYHFLNKYNVYIILNICTICIFILLFIEILIAKIHNTHIVNIEIKNKSLKSIYNILFWLGIICSILYLIMYIWLVSKFAN